MKKLNVSSIITCLTALIITGVPQLSNAATIYGCQSKLLGFVRIVSSSTGCDTKLEIPISWNSVGPIGPTGATGATGATGPQGPAGVAKGISTVAIGDFAWTGIWGSSSGQESLYGSLLYAHSCGYRRWGDQTVQDYYVQWPAGTFTSTPTCFATMSNQFSIVPSTPAKLYAPVVTSGAVFNCAAWSTLSSYDPTNTVTVSVATDYSCGQYDQLGGCPGWVTFLKTECDIAAAGSGDPVSIAACQAIGCSLPNISCIVSGAVNIQCIQ